MKLVGKNAEILANHYKLCLEKKGYAFFDKDKAYNLNIIGVRKNDKFTNKFDDKIVLIYRDDYKVWNFHEFRIFDILRNQVRESPFHQHRWNFETPVIVYSCSY